MITHLSIQGLAIIDSLTIDFTSGFNVITGETGAGKSILIRGLNFLMGAKASTEAVRQGYEQATVIGEFQVPAAHPALPLLGKLGIPVDAETGAAAILVRRQISAKGRSQSWINDVPVTTQPLRELGATLVDVFAQHENQRLMDEGQHLSYVDSFLGDAALVKTEVGELSRACHGIVAELERTIETFFAREKSKDYLVFRRDALKRFNPSEEDYASVQSSCEKAERSEKLRETIGKVMHCLDGETGEKDSPAKAVREAARLLGALGDEGIGSLRESAETIARSLDDLSYEVGRLASAFEGDEGTIEQAQARLFGYQDLFRKHGVRDIEGLLGESARLDAELDFLESVSTKLEALLHQLVELATRLSAASKRLSEARLSAARVIKRKVESELQELAMPGAKLDVRFVPVTRALPALDLSILGEELLPLWDKARALLAEIGEWGAERGEFLLASNPGEPALPLARVASGGEMSRIMLALKKALVADAETCVLVFDEIDAGISGRVADVVGRKMQELASGFQVLCISHLPQVAVYADAHFLVHKAGRGTRTESTIVRLTADESAREIARLLSGAEVTPTSLAHAKSLIERARAGVEGNAPDRAAGVRAAPERQAPAPTKGRAEKRVRPKSPESLRI